MSANIDQLAPTKSLIDLSKYSTDEVSLQDHKLTDLFDDLILAEYTDISQDGSAIKRGDIWVPLNATPKAWRIGRVLIKGAATKNVDVGQQIVFPSDKGIPVTKLQYVDSEGNTQRVEHGVFLNEERLFGTCTPISE
tara:strand:+ start:72 stop:482 length:411 start_codon:yes stop_codon:yes gene_type:complete